MKDCLNLYEKASGQLINFDKSAITFSNKTPRDHIEFIKGCLNIFVCQGHDLYLGLPTFSILSKRIQFGYIRDRVAKRLDCWKNKFFSEAGREILIKAIIQAIPTFAMSYFRIPTSILKDIEKLCANFWWGNSATNKRVHWKSWKLLKEAKEIGGMGFRDLVIFNKALLAKQVWRILSNPENIVSKVLKRRYVRHLDIMEASIGNNPSYIWRSLMWSRDILDEGLYWKVGNCKKVNIINDRWIPNRSLSRVIFINSDTVNKKVCDLLSPNYSWDSEILDRAFFPFEKEAIYKVPLTGPDREDSRF